MFGRPRCREWTPLATQQLRLRSLIQIVGYNIRPPEWCVSQCSFYLTLHHTTMSAPFYTSERISSPHPKWKEIDSEMTHSMSATNVVIRIWCHILNPNRDTEDCARPQDTVIQTWGVYLSGLRYIGANLALNFNSDCFKSNTLVFQLHGGYFCSYKSLKLDVIPPENEIEHGSLSSDSSGRTNVSKNTLEPRAFINYKPVKESRSVSPSRSSRKSDKEYSKSNSPVERGFKHNFPKMRMSASLHVNQTQRDSCSRYKETSDSKNLDPNYIYEHSPDNSDVKEFTTCDINCDNLSKNVSTEDLSASKIDLSETAENYDLRNEFDGVPKYRYLALSFLKSEIRPSYNSIKLQKLHLLQYSIKKKQEAVQEIKERIYKNSAFASNNWTKPVEQVIKSRSKSQKNLFVIDDDEQEDKLSNHNDERINNGKIKNDSRSNGPRLALKLNDLLAFKSKPSPLQRAEHVRLTKQIEILRFKRIILADERDSKLANIRRLKEIHSKLCEENQDIGSELMENYHTLCRRNEALKETRQSCGALLELASRSHAALASRRFELLTQLRQIFYIEQVDDAKWTICDVPLPICDDNPRVLSPVSDAVSAGYVAQATCLVAAILNQPVRYKITLLGSASKIMDITADLPDPHIPLFARGGDMTLFRYAMFLLNKCIAQLLYGRGIPVPDMRPTLSNLHRLLTKPANFSDTTKLFGTYKWLSDNKCPRTQSLRSMVASDRGKFRQFNRFKDAVDGQSPQSLMNLQRHRHSRSVGSYNDDRGLSAFNNSTTSIMGSEPNIYDTKLKQESCVDLSQTILKPHNSDSEISRLTVEQKIVNNNGEKVVFTVGDDMFYDKEKLVRISTNNGDAGCSTCLDDNVKKICTEIENFCLVSDHKPNSDVSEGFDIAAHVSNLKDIDLIEYMERQHSVEVENVNLCETCKHNEGGICELVCAKNVTDVIVIPSAEAILIVDCDASEVVENVQES